MKNKFKSLFIGTIAFISAFFMISLLIIILFKPYNYAIAQGKIAIYTASNTVASSNIRENLKTSKHANVVDTVSINNSYLEKIRQHGQLLTSDEFASRISDYYNSLIATLTALFVVFTLTTYFTIRSKFERKFEEKENEINNKLINLESNFQKLKQSIRNELNKDISVELHRMLIDSLKVRAVIDETIGGHIDDKVANKEELDAVTDDIGKIVDDLKDIKQKQNELYGEIANLKEEGAILYHIDESNDPQSPQVYGVETPKSEESPTEERNV